MKTIKLFLFLSLASSSIVSIAFANNRTLPGVEIISRAERGADENVAFDDHPEYDIIRDGWKLSAEKAEILKTSNPLVYKQNQLNRDIASNEKEIRNNFLNENFAYRFTVDYITEAVNNRSYRWPRKFNNNKSQIIIHHTVTDTSKLTNTDLVKSEIRNIYSYHAFTRQRGDIGYNFIIGPLGNIYEGRAGGDGVVGAHSKYNNSPSIGIALMGNFENINPSKEQIDSLIKLSTSLSLKYNINPYEQLAYHRDQDEDPYVQTLYNHTIAGHKDAGRTACPGTNLYNKIPEIIEKVASNLAIQKVLVVDNKPHISRISSKLNKITYDKNIPINSNGHMVVPNASWAEGAKKCLIIKNKQIIGNCEYKNEQLFSTNTINHGEYVLFTIGEGNKYSIASITTKINNLTPIQVQEKTLSLDEQKLLYIKNSSISFPKQLTNKFQSPIDINQIKRLKNQKVNVLLLEATNKLDTYKISCTSMCHIETDKFNGNYKSFDINIVANQLILDVNGNKQNIQNITISTANATDQIIINNYNRKSYAGIARNSFFGSIEILKQPIPSKDGTKKEDYAIINNLSLKQYLAGIVESNDTESLEHNKTLALIAKNYVLFYLDVNHNHPNITESAKYNAIDDPDYFQKYVGAGLTQTLTKRYTALNYTNNQYLLYKGNLTFTPFFSCSPGFTRSAKEKWGWKDTPYLISQKDSSNCTVFKGHGVGLSGRGAAQLAKSGKTYAEILKYYFPGTEITTIY